MIIKFCLVFPKIFLLHKVVRDAKKVEKHCPKELLELSTAQLHKQQPKLSAAWEKHSNPISCLPKGRGLTSISDQGAATKCLEWIRLTGNFHVSAGSSMSCAKLLNQFITVFFWKQKSCTRVLQFFSTGRQLIACRPLARIFPSEPWDAPPLLKNKFFSVYAKFLS